MLNDGGLGELTSTCDDESVNGGSYNPCGPGLQFEPTISVCVAIPILAFVPSPEIKRKPKFLIVTRDCYDVPTNGGFVTREVDYKLYDDQPSPQFYAAPLYERLVGDLPACGAVCPAGPPPGYFNDRQSINISTGSTQHVVQSFFAVTALGNVDVFVLGFGGQYGTLDIRKTSGVIYINGNAGGQVDDKTGKLIPGTYEPCH